MEIEPVEESGGVLNNEVEMIRSNKGGLKIIHRGYMYTVHKRKGGRIRWRCVRRALHCKGSISTGNGLPISNLPHNHVPDPHAVALARCRTVWSSRTHGAVDSSEEDVEMVRQLSNSIQSSLSSTAAERMGRPRPSVSSPSVTIQPTSSRNQSKPTPLSEFRIKSPEEAESETERMPRRAIKKEPNISEDSDSDDSTDQGIRTTRSKAAAARRIKRSPDSSNQSGSFLKSRAPPSVEIKPIPLPVKRPATPQEEVCLRWNSHHSNMRVSFPHLLDREQYVDVTLAVNGGKLKCHRLILSSCSAFFDDILKDIQPNQHPVIYITDIKLWELKALVEFMYKGEVSCDQGQLEELLKAAKTLKVKGLTSRDEPPVTKQEPVDHPEPRPLPIRTPNLPDRPKPISLLRPKQQQPLLIRPKSSLPHSIPIRPKPSMLPFRQNLPVRRFTYLPPKTQPKIQPKPQLKIQPKVQPRIHLKRELSSDEEYVPYRRRVPVNSRRGRKRKPPAEPRRVYMTRRGTRTLQMLGNPQLYDRDYESPVRNSVSPPQQDTEPNYDIVNVKVEPEDHDTVFENSQIFVESEQIITKNETVAERLPNGIDNADSTMTASGDNMEVENMELETMDHGKEITVPDGDFVNESFAQVVPPMPPDGGNSEDANKPEFHVDIVNTWSESTGQVGVQESDFP